MIWCIDLHTLTRLVKSQNLLSNNFNDVKQRNVKNYLNIPKAPSLADRILTPFHAFWILISIITFNNNFNVVPLMIGRSQWPRGLRRRSSAARLLRLWVRIPPWAWMFVCCECCVLSGRGLCDVLITRPEESYRLWCVLVCDQETSKTRRLKPAIGLWKYNHNGFNARKTNKQPLVIGPALISHNTPEEVTTLIRILPHHAGAHVLTKGHICEIVLVIILL